MQLEHRLDNSHSLLVQTLLPHLRFHSLETDFLQLVDSHGNIRNLVRITANLSQSGQHLTVIYPDGHTDAELRENSIDNLHKLQLIDLRLTSDNISIALVELAVATLLRSIRTPDRLNLETPERECDFILMLNHIARKRDRQIVPEALLTHRRRDLSAVQTTVFAGIIFRVNVFEGFSAVQNSEQEFVTLVTIFSEKCGKILHRRSLDLDISVSPVDRTDCIEYVVSGGHFLLAEVPCPLRYRRFLCHS